MNKKLFVWLIVFVATVLYFMDENVLTMLFMSTALLVRVLGVNEGDMSQYVY